VALLAAAHACSRAAAPRPGAESEEIDDASKQALREILRQEEE
jgi:hypothetical protein